MDNEPIIAWELLAILVTLLGGFGTLAFQVGRRSKDIDVLTEATKKNAEALQEHDEECKLARAADAEWKRDIEKRLAEGSKHMAVFDERGKTIQEDIREIKEVVKGQSSA